MSSNDPDFPPIPNLGSSLYLEYKEAVYDTLFTGIVCGEGQETRRYSSNF